MGGQQSFPQAQKDVVRKESGLAVGRECSHTPARASGPVWAEMIQTREAGVDSGPGTGAAVSTAHPTPNLQAAMALMSHPEWGCNPWG